MNPAVRWALPPHLDRHLNDVKARAAKALESMPWRPSLLMATAGVASIAAVANAMAASSAADPAPTRMGVSIQQSMGERDQALARQKRGLDLREQAMKAAEQRLKADLETRQGQDPVDSPRADSRQAADATEPYDDLARIYQTMKPARAAPIFERLDLEVQVQIAKHMRERSTALLMSSMSPNRAVELSMALAGRKVIPQQAGPRPATQAPGKRAIAAAEPTDGKALSPAANPAGRSKGRP